MGENKEDEFFDKLAEAAKTGLLKGTYSDDTPLFDDAEEGSLAAKALGAMQEDETPMEIAERLKIEGNAHFQHALKHGKNHFKLAIRSYTQAIAQNARDKEQTSIILSNRAQCHLSLKNHGHALKDADAALKLDEKLSKAHYRGIRAALGLRRWEDVVHRCQKAVRMVPSLSPKVDKLLIKAQRGLKKHQKELEATAAKKARVSESISVLNQALMDRGVVLGVPREGLESFSPFLDKEGDMHYPVVIMVPEYAVSDVLQDVHEGATLKDVLSRIVPCTPPLDPPVPRPPWDQRGDYMLQKLHAYVELGGTPRSVYRDLWNERGNEPKMSGWVRVKMRHHIMEIAARKECMVHGAVVLAIVLKGSDQERKLVCQ